MQTRVRENIYSRQTIIDGWDQDRLLRASVAIVGSGWTAAFCALNLVCLGMGRVYLIDDARAQNEEWWLFAVRSDQPRALAWCDWFRALGLGQGVIGRATDPVCGQTAVLPPSDAVVLASNRPGRREALEYYSRSRGVPVAVVEAGLGSGRLCFLSGQHQAACRSETEAPSAQGNRSSFSEEGALPGAILGAMAASEVLHSIMPVAENERLPDGKHLCYSLAWPQRFRFSELLEPDIEPPKLPAESHVMLVGAGALGTFAALALIAQGDLTRLTIVDPDYIEVSNTNRQPFYVGRIGSGKAFVLAERLSEMRPGAQIDYIGEAVSSAHFDKLRPDLVLLAVDNWAARKLVHDECLARSIPVINGGTAAFSGHLETYQPGVTCCLNCLIGLDDKAETERLENLDPAQCGRRVEPAIVTTNAVVGALMAAEVLHCLCASDQRVPLRFALRYDLSSSQRVLSGRPRPACTCCAAGRSG